MADGDAEDNVRGVTTPLGRGTAVLVAAGAFLLGAAAPALAHNPMVSSVPAKGATVAVAPQIVTLKFEESLDPKTTHVQIAGPNGYDATGGAKPTFAKNVATVPFTAGPAGVYLVSYDQVAEDGDPLKGKFSFTLTAGASPSATATAAPSASAAAPSPAPVAKKESGSTIVWWLIGAVVVGGAGVVLLRRRSSQQD